MKFITFLKKQMTLALAVGVLLSLNSCGSFQYSGIYEDGIYSESKPAQQVNETVDNTSNSSEYYKNYFKEKSLQIQEDNATVFTDVDSYEGTYANDTENANDYAGWGENNSSEIIVNVYDNGPFYGNGWGFNYWNNWGVGFWQPNYYNSWYRPWNNPWYNPYCFYGCYTNYGYFNNGYNRYIGRSYAYINGGRSRYRNSRSLSTRSVLSATTRSRTNTRSNTRSATRSRSTTTRSNSRSTSQSRTTTRPTRSNSITRPRTTTRPSNNTSRSNSSYRTTRSTTRSSSPSRSSTRSSTRSSSPRSSRSSGGSTRRRNN